MFSRPSLEGLSRVWDGLVQAGQFYSDLVFAEEDAEESPLQLSGVSLLLLRGVLHEYLLEAGGLDVAQGHLLVQRESPDSLRSAFRIKQRVVDIDHIAYHIGELPE
ncbi:MAG TPA: hypothetical protein VM050_10175 [Patescibacteria group bacterium]|nr:hypothetical protein [Patescibacteria group bacterium]